MATSSARMSPLVYPRQGFLTAQVDAFAAAINQPGKKPAATPAPKTKQQKKMPARRGQPARTTAATRAKASLCSSKSAAKTRIDTASESSFEHHRRKCLVCNHPEREAIEELFINWHSPRAIHGEFGIHPRLDWSSIYRHARAAGLYAKRRKNLRAVFDLVLEQAADVAPTAHGIVAVVRGYSCLTDTHEWVEPEKRVRIANHVYRHDLPAAPDVPACPDEATVAPLLPTNRQPPHQSRSLVTRH